MVPWILLPPLVFLAGYAGGVLPFAVGQMAFTMFVVLAVDIIVPKGWHTGEIRLIDVAAGAAVSVVVGLVFWPRGGTCRCAVPSLRCIARPWRCSDSVRGGDGHVGRELDRLET